MKEINQVAKVLYKYIQIFKIYVEDEAKANVESEKLRKSVSFPVNYMACQIFERLTDRENFDPCNVSSVAVENNKEHRKIIVTCQTFTKEIEEEDSVTLLREASTFTIDCKGG